MAVHDLGACSYWAYGAHLLHQQCWCWGRDIRRSEGNLLLEYGFERVRPPATIAGSSRYCRTCEQSKLYLWGFGVAFVQQDGAAIYINRYNFVPRWLNVEISLDHVWAAEQLAAFAPPDPVRLRRRTRRLLKRAMLEFAGYEAWVLNGYGVWYRREALREWHLPAVLPERLPEEWTRLSWHVPDLPLPSRPAVGSARSPE